MVKISAAGITIRDGSLVCAEKEGFQWSMAVESWLLLINCAHKHLPPGEHGEAISSYHSLFFPFRMC